MQVDIQEYIPVLIPLIILQIGLALYAIVDVFKHPHYKFGNRTLWLIVCAFISFLGPILYFAFGKGED